MSFPKSKVSLSEDEALARKLQEEEEEEEEDRVSDLFPTQMIEQDEILARMLQEQEDRAYENSKKRKAETQGGDWFNLFRKWSKEADPQQTLTSDRELAQQLQLEEEERNERNDGPSAGSSSSNKDPDKLIKYLDIEDPNPDLHELFLAFDKQFFHNKLAAVEVKWSTRLTLCAGICQYNVGGACTIKLSEPLLKFRSRMDMVNTLLHEMIHALLFVTMRYDNHDGHGPEFLREAERINKLAGTNITVYHNFHDEVDHYRRHVWRCDGPCQDRPPYFGIVKRSMNRPPQPADYWFSEHKSTCGGTFRKIAEPEETSRKRRKKNKNIEDFFTKPEKRDTNNSNSVA